MKLKYWALGLGGIFCFFPFLAYAATGQQDMDRVEYYLNSIGTLRAAVVQSSAGGGLAHGMLYIQRPGKMRLDYDPPNKNFIVSNGTFIYFWDDDLKQQTHTLLSTTLANLMLAEHLHFGDEIAVKKITHKGQSLEVTAFYAKDPALGQMTLIFDDQPLRLKKWRVVDGQNLTTEVTLLNLETGLPLPGSLFHFHKPDED